MTASPTQVFSVLANGWSYSNWVVGSSHMRAVGSAWPAPGSKLHHASGAWPLTLHDETVVDEVEPDRRLVLTVKGRPLGSARVIMTLSSATNGTRVVMEETPIAGPGKWFHNPATEALLTRRNVESLARLAALAERHTSPPDE